MRVLCVLMIEFRYLYCCMSMFKASIFWSTGDIVFFFIICQIWVFTFVMIWNYFHKLKPRLDLWYYIHCRRYDWGDAIEKSTITGIIDFRWNAADSIKCTRQLLFDLSWCVALIYPFSIYVYHIIPTWTFLDVKH